MATLQEIFDEAKVLVPEDYHWHYCSFCSTLGPMCGGMEYATEVAPPGFRSTPFDETDPRWLPKEIVVPTPTTPECLFIALHEVGHVVLRHSVKQAVSFGPGTWRYYHKEIAASTWAKEFMEARGVFVSTELWATADRFARGNSDEPLTS